MEQRFDMATIKARLTCSICKKYFREATTINECLHTFCKKCIYDKLGVDEDSETEAELTETFDCPVCDVDIGPCPREKLRPDHSLQNLRNRVFPLRRREAKKLKVGPSEDPPATGTVVSTQNEGKSSSIGEASQSVPKGGTENAAEELKEQTGEWEPLSCLTEAAKKSKPPKSSNSLNKGKAKVDNEKAGKNPGSSGEAKPKKMGRGGQKRERATGESSTLFKAASGTSAKVISRFRPIWFSLMASEEQDGGAPLHQIPSKYLRIVDGSMPVSIIQQHISKKLHLKSEDEVEITCLGQPLMPALQLRELVEMWLQALPSSRRISPTAGSSGADIMLVLEYARKIPTPEPQPEVSLAT